MPRVQICSPSYRSGNDVKVHLGWNTPQKHGGKQSGDVDWSIITKPRPSSTQKAQLQLQSIRNVMPYLTILVLESLPNATPQHCPWSLINLTGSLYKEAQSDEVSKRKSPWQQRRPCKRTTYTPSIFSSDFNVTSPAKLILLYIKIQSGAVVRVIAQQSCCLGVA